MSDEILEEIQAELSDISKSLSDISESLGIITQYIINEGNFNVKVTGSLDVDFNNFDSILRKIYRTLKNNK